MSKLGSLEFLEALFKEIARCEGFGEILAEGVMRAAKRMGKDAEQIEYSGRPFPYGPKVFLQSALLYATEPRPLVTELHEVCEPIAN